MKILLIVAVSLLFLGYIVSYNEDEDYYGYEDDGYEYFDDESEEQLSFEQPKPLEGYPDSPHERLVRIPKHLVNDLYISTASEVYECVPRAQARRASTNVFDNSTEFNITSEIEAIMAEFQGMDSNPSSNYSIQINETNVTNETVREKRKSFREVQQERMRLRRESLQRRQQEKPKYLLGADCETLVCGSCKAIVEEFSSTVKKNYRNPSITSIEAVFEGFCESKEIAVKYDNIVGNICRQLKSPVCIPIL